MESRKQFRSKILLQHNLSPCQRNTTARSGIIWRILQQNFQCLLYRIILSNFSQCIRKTMLRALQALLAQVALQSMSRRRHLVRMLSTYCKTHATINAFLLLKRQFDFRANSLRIVAPGTMQIAPFKKNRRANPWPVFGRKPLKIKNQALLSCVLRHKPSLPNHLRHPKRRFSSRTSAVFNQATSL